MSRDFHVDRFAFHQLDGASCETSCNNQLIYSVGDSLNSRVSDARRAADNYCGLQGDPQLITLFPVGCTVVETSPGYTGFQGAFDLSSIDAHVSDASFRILGYPTTGGQIRTVVES